MDDVSRAEPDESVEKSVDFSGDLDQLAVVEAELAAAEAELTALDATPTGSHDAADS